MEKSITLVEVIEIKARGHSERLRPWSVFGEKHPIGIDRISLISAKAAKGSVEALKSNSKKE